MGSDWRCVFCVAALLTGADVEAQTPVLGPATEREVNAAAGTAFKSTAADEAAAAERFTAYTMALARRDYAAAYAMFRLSLQASTPRLEWEMNLRKRSALWADGTLRVLRLSWYANPAGQPEGLYAAFDFRGDRADGTMDCGYVAVHRASPEAPFTVVRTDTSEVPPELIEEGVPKADVLRQLPCYLGKGIATAL